MSVMRAISHTNAFLLLTIVHYRLHTYDDIELRLWVNTAGAIPFGIPGRGPAPGDIPNDISL